jgi:two-component sensor histidine kinase/CheY-like chemotaxis protein
MANRKPRVLIIDDDEAFCRLAADHLELSGFETVRRHSAREGIQAALGEDFDAVILDHVLPGYDGLTLLNSLKVHEPPLPVVYLTDSKDSRLAVTALKAGAADYVIKDSNCDFLLLLENAVTNAMFAAAIKRDKEKAEAEVRAARDQFKALAEERALLLREVNHRVANSLQLIASCLHFQADMSESQVAKAALSEANTRVLAVARVHRSLYASFDIRWISLPSYLATMIGDLKDVAAGRNGEESSIALHADQIQTGPDAAVAVGIVAAELILNALRHGYPDGSGPVRVWLRADGPDVKLIVEDDGTGGVEGLPGRRGLGQRIMAGMAEKLDGSLHYERRDHGTRAVLTFPLGKDVRLMPGTREDMAPAA